MSKDIKEKTEQRNNPTSQQLFRPWRRWRSVVIKWEVRNNGVRRWRCWVVFVRRWRVIHAANDTTRWLGSIVVVTPGLSWWWWRVVVAATTTRGGWRWRWWAVVGVISGRRWWSCRRRWRRWRRRWDLLLARGACYGIGTSLFWKYWTQ